MNVEKIQKHSSSKRSPTDNPEPTNPEVSADQLAGTMKAMAYPQRIRILQALSEKGMYFSELADLTGLKTTALNNNLNILLDAELIKQEHKRGRYLATETGKQLLSTLSKVLSDMSPTAISYMRQYHRLYHLTRKRTHVLEGVPPLGWGKDIECTFLGALDAALRFLGEPVDYVYLMGVSAAAFRLRFHQPEWCPSSPDAALDETYAQQALRSIGYSGQLITKETTSKKEINRIIRGEIRREIPVVAIDLVKVPDWGVVTGYQNGKLLCRTYYDKSDEYSVAEKDPWIIFKLEKAGHVPDRLDSIRGSFRLAVELANKERIDHYANGFAAYDAWIKDLENEDMFSKLDEDAFRHHWHVNGWVYDSLFDARLATTKYLQGIQEEFSGKEKATISEAAEKFESIKTALFDSWIYFPLPGWVKNGKTWTPKGMIDGDTWTPQMRKKGAETLKMIRAKEREAFEVLSRIS